MSRPPTLQDFRELSHRGPWTRLVDDAQAADGLAQEVTGAVRLVFEMTRSPATLQQIGAMVGTMTLGQAIMVAAVVLRLEEAGDLSRMGEHHFTVPAGVAAALDEHETPIAFYRAAEPVTDRDYREMSQEGSWSAILGEPEQAVPQRLTGRVLTAIEQLTGGLALAGPNVRPAPAPGRTVGASMMRIGDALGAVTVRQGAAVACTVHRLVQAGVLVRTGDGGFARADS